jgi:aspartyl-tRNA(Asn)/glutamyl-tRNA(Gln) amidotransferase subunit A
MRLFPDDHETITGTARRLRSGETTCVEVLQTCLDRIDEKEEAVHAWVLVDREGALRQAEVLDAELRAGQDRGPLHGIPIGIKDISSVLGLPTSCGMQGWDWNVPSCDAPIVAKLREVGAIILGKTASTPFAWIDPSITRNPWNLDRTPGGSSSGSAAAVACGMCLGAIGTQTGGSITRPASFCGIAGMKPTYDSVSTEGIFPLAPSLDHAGPLARSVADLRSIFEAIRRSCVREEQWAPWVRGNVDRPRLAAPFGMFESRASVGTQIALRNAIEQLSDAGAEICAGPNHIDFDSILKDHRLIMAAEAAATHQGLKDPVLPQYPPRIADLLQEGQDISAVDYIQARERQFRDQETIDDLLRIVDALVVPATLGPAPDVSTTGDPVFNSPWSFLGVPTVSFPLGLSAEGLPLAVQLIGRDGFDLHLLRTAEWCETVIRSANRES